MYSNESRKKWSRKFHTINKQEYAILNITYFGSLLISISYTSHICIVSAIQAKPPEIYFEFLVNRSHLLLILRKETMHCGELGGVGGRGMVRKRVLERTTYRIWALIW